MNFRLVAYVSLFGVAMGIASVLGIVHAGQEGLLWLAIAVASAFWIALQAPSRRFAHGFLAGFLAGVIAPLIQVMCFSAYLAHNPKAAESFRMLPANMPARVVVLVLAPVIGILYGLILGLLAVLAGKIVGRKGAAGAPG